MGPTGALEAALKMMLLPPASLLLLYVLGLLAGRRAPRLGELLRHGAVALLYLLSTGVGSWLLVHPLESREPALASGPVPHAQAIVVLSAGRIKHSPEYGGRAMPDFTALERMAYAALLARRTGLPLLASGGLLSEAPDDEALAIGMQRVFQNQFQLPVRWLETASRNTAENARFSAAILKRAGVSHVILVTNALHMRRARLAFEREGIAVTPGPTFYLEPGRFDLRRIWPGAENLRRSFYAVYEWLGLARDKFL